MIPGAVGPCLAKGRSAILEEHPAVHFLDREGRDHRFHAPPAHGGQQPCLVRRRASHRLGPERTAIRRDADDGRPRPDVGLFRRARQLEPEGRELVGLPAGEGDEPVRVLPGGAGDVRHPPKNSRIGLAEHDSARHGRPQASSIVRRTP